MGREVHSTHGGAAVVCGSAAGRPGSSAAPQAEAGGAVAAETGPAGAGKRETRLCAKHRGGFPLQPLGRGLKMRATR